MADGLISVDVLKSRVLQGQFKIGQDGTWYVLGLIDSMPTIDAAPIKHGRWEQVEVVHDRKDAKIQDWQQAKCSVCGKWHTTPYMYYLKLDNYCPNCGAIMNEVEE